MAWCDRCDRYFNCNHALWQHEDNSSRHHICRQCGKDFTTPNGLVQHYTQSSRHSYCQGCDEHFDDDEDLEQHFINSHHYCSKCRRFFVNDFGLKEHYRQSHWYCKACNRIFRSESNLDAHLQSSIHQPRNIKCPGCQKGFVSTSALILHCEQGYCPSGVDRRAINRLVVSLDRSNVITDPRRLIAGPGGTYSAPAAVTQWATGASWNGRAYECVLCHKEFERLAWLNAHLQSPAHEKKIFRCPVVWDGCNTKFSTLSGLVQHVERGNCGVRRFRGHVDNLIGSVANRMRTLTL